MPDDLVIARNPDADSSLPYLVRIPLGPNGIILKVRDTWPRTTKVYCHRAEEWPADQYTAGPTKSPPGRPIHRRADQITAGPTKSPPGRPIHRWSSSQRA